MSDTPTTRAKAKMAKDRDTNGSDARDIDAFRLDIIEAFKDPSVAEQMAAAFAPHLERIADKMCERLDAKVKIMTQQLQARDQKIQSLENTVNILQLKIDDQEQYSRRESLRISGIPEMASENTDQIVMTLCNETPRCDPPLQDSDLARSHRSGDIEKTNRVILAKFSTYKIRDRVIRARTNLKDFNKDNDNPIYINEDLTKRKADLLYRARQFKKEKLILDTWTWDGLVRIKDNMRKVHVINTIEDLNAFRGWFGISIWVHMCTLEGRASAVAALWSQVAFGAVVMTTSDAACDSWVAVVISSLVRWAHVHSYKMYSPRNKITGIKWLDSGWNYWMITIYTLFLMIKLPLKAYTKYWFV